MVSMKALLSVFFALVFGAIAIGQSSATSHDYWIYYAKSGKLEIIYNGATIRVLPEVGDGSFDRPFNLKPARRYVFISENVSLRDASNIVSFWKSFDPKTPCDFVIIFDDGGMRTWPTEPVKLSVPPELGEAVRKSVRK